MGGTDRLFISLPVLCYLTYRQPVFDEPRQVADLQSAAVLQTNYLNLTPQKIRMKYPLVFFFRKNGRFVTQWFLERARPNNQDLLSSSASASLALL
jgi:hypothetical protein